MLNVVVAILLTVILRQLAEVEANCVMFNQDYCPVANSNDGICV